MLLALSMTSVSSFVVVVAFAETSSAASENIVVVTFVVVTFIVVTFVVVTFVVEPRSIVIPLALQKHLCHYQ